ncbi:MAG: aminotransferase class I/II-fold pyridoxal phosphate-dependent enzyme [Mesorhizobium sp.]|nr:MAG: aminotransferase class I/II-fold pyridoxal phosphate-dependent enzyme [Mesorhizobium sp.]TIP39563.1 MAG: aminotransferase class I/II-fold pyridoxal phosphate-dependent enzyme [Mesorhizobium sp.]TIQ06348.1 MAG: aminotransferase class I/II-fold pyridoxal phosphate-dependent enzyme [Mesorhizobium sp.]
MGMVQSLAIVVTDPRQMISTWNDRFSVALGFVSGTSVLRRLLSQLALAGVQKTIVLALKSMGDVGSDFGGDLNGMELCFRVLPTPNAGRLVDAATAEEIADADGDVLVFTENLVIDFSLIERLLRSSDHNAVVVDKSHAKRSLRILADKEMRVKATLPKCSVTQKNASEDLAPVGLYKFEPALLRSIARNRQHRLNDDLEFFEVALGIHARQIHVMHAEPQRVMTVNDAVDLEAANFAFSSDTDQFATVERLHGGYWRYPVREHILLCNCHFPPAALFDRLSERLPELLHLYPSGHREIASRVAAMADLPAEYLAIGNGTSELIKALYGHLKPRVVIPTPTFVEYQNALAPNKVISFKLPADNFDLDVDEFARFAKAREASVAVVVNPNNPTGRLVSVEDLRRLASSLATAKCRLVIDESFIEFSDAGKENSLEGFLSEYPNTIILKSLGKIFGLGGARLGYLASADNQLVHEVRRHLPLWNINGIAEYLLWLLPEFRDEWKASLRHTRAGIASFSRMLSAIPGFKVLPSQANYLFCRIPDAWTGAKHAAEVLATQHGVLVRHCGYQSMRDGDRYLRLTARTDEDNSYLVSALRQINDEFGSRQAASS